MSWMSIASRSVQGSRTSISGHGLGWDTPEGRRVLNDVTFALGAERSGLVGPNGAGKTTLVNLLTGALSPTRGHVERQGSIACLPQDFRIDADRSVAEVLGIAPRLEALRRIDAGDTDEALYALLGDDWDIADRAEALLARLGLDRVDLDRRLGSLSGGETTRVVLASRLILEPDYLILDEPTNNLDRDARQALYDLIDGWTGGLLVVSHDRALLEHVDQVLELSVHGLKRYGGAYGDYVAQREVEEAAARRVLTSAEQQLRRDQREAREAAERQAHRNARGRRLRARGDVPRIMLNAMRNRAEQSTARLQEVHEQRVAGAKERLEAARASIRPHNVIQIDLAATRVASGRRVLELDQVSFSYDGPGGRPLFQGLELELIGPTRVALLGSNGSGKTTLLRLMLGELEPTSGRVRLGVSGVAWLDQRLELLDPEASVRDNFRRLNPGIDESLARLRLGRFLFRGDAALRPVRSLSGGERMRAALACVLAGGSPPRLLVLDEPTNNLDLDSIEQVESALSNFRGALIVVSHDRTFLERLGIERTFSLD